MKKVIAVLLVVILIANLILFGLQKIKPLWFWLVIGIVAVISYWLKQLSENLIN